MGGKGRNDCDDDAMVQPDIHVGIQELDEEVAQVYPDETRSHGVTNGAASVLSWSKSIKVDGHGQYSRQKNIDIEYRSPHHQIEGALHRAGRQSVGEFVRHSIKFPTSAPAYKERNVHVM